MNHESKAEASAPLLSYEICEDIIVIHPGPPARAQRVTTVHEFGHVTEAQLREIRKEKLEPFPTRRIIVNWPHPGPEWISTGTLEGWIGRQRG